MPYHLLPAHVILGHHHLMAQSDHSPSLMPTIKATHHYVCIEQPITHVCIEVLPKEFKFYPKTWVLPAEVPWHTVQRNT